MLIVLFIFEEMRCKYLLFVPKRSMTISFRYKFKQTLTTTVLFQLHFLPSNRMLPAASDQYYMPAYTFGPRL